MAHDANQRWDNLQKRVASILRRLKVHQNSPLTFIPDGSICLLSLLNQCPHNVELLCYFSTIILTAASVFYLRSTLLVRERSSRRPEMAFWCGWLRWICSWPTLSTSLSVTFRPKSNNSGSVCHEISDSHRLPQRLLCFEYLLSLFNWLDFSLALKTRLRAYVSLYIFISTVSAKTHFLTLTNRFE